MLMVCLWLSVALLVIPAARLVPSNQAVHKRLCCTWKSWVYGIRRVTSLLSLVTFVVSITCSKPGAL